LPWNSEKPSFYRIDLIYRENRRRSRSPDAATKKALIAGSTLILRKTDFTFLRIKVLPAMGSLFSESNPLSTESILFIEKTGDAPAVLMLRQKKR
jgi:hypothetical protein